MASRLEEMFNKRMDSLQSKEGKRESKAGIVVPKGAADPSLYGEDIFAPRVEDRTILDDEDLSVAADMAEGDHPEVVLPLDYLKLQEEREAEEAAEAAAAADAIATAERNVAARKLRSLKPLSTEDFQKE